jgi:heat shock protein HslJ
LEFGQNGRTRAKAGCNFIGGDARIEDGRLVLGEIGITDIGCGPARLDQDAWLLDFLGSRPTVSLTGDELVLRTGKVEVRLTDREVVDPDRALLYTMWNVETIITAEAAYSITDDAQALLVIDMAGDVSAHTGCALLFGRVEARAASIVFPPALPSAQVDCSGARMVLDKAVRAALRGEVAFSIEAHSLTLRGPDGHGLVLRET